MHGALCEVLQPDVAPVLPSGDAGAISHRAISHRRHLTAGRTMQEPLHVCRAASGHADYGRRYAWTGRVALPPRASLQYRQ